ncbi:MAG: DUF427 domain-containing protein [Pseudomonadota bacterium]
MDAQPANQFDSPKSYQFSFEPTTARIVAKYGDEILADTDNAMVLRETRIAPVYYFPREDVRMELFQRSDYISYCPFKGNASHYSLTVNNGVVENVLWSYEEPLAEAENIKNYVAFYSDRVSTTEQDPSDLSNLQKHANSHYANPLMEWVLHEAPAFATVRELTPAFARQLRIAGIPVWDMTVVMPTLHPQVAALVHSWSSVTGELTELEPAIEDLQSPEFLNSPLVPLFKGAGGIRRRLDIENPQLDFGVLKDLVEVGATDYVAMPMVFSDGQINAVCMSSDRPGGFSTHDLGNLYEILDIMGRVYEVHSQKRKAMTLLDTYLGQHAGERVLNGSIRRGDSENIRAVIWFCDLRGSTPLAQSLSREEFIASLNEYFDSLAGAVLDNGGQVLRYIGDAALAIFPIEGDRAQDGIDAHKHACEQALNAIVEAESRMNSVNQKRQKANKPRLEYGIALHIGDVSYGNIGTGSRLEFTVIGDAANRAARIESMCKSLGQTVLMSADFVNVFSDKRFASLGEHDLRGIDGVQEIFTIAK